MHDMRTKALGRVAGSAVLAAAVVTGCATSAHLPAGASLRSASVTSTSTRPTPAVAPKAAAAVVAQRLVRAALLPPGAAPSNAALPPLMRGPWQTTGSTNLVVTNRVWTVPGDPSAVVAYLRSHAPPGLTSNGIGSLSGPTGRVQYVVDVPRVMPVDVSEAGLEIGVGDGGAGTSLVNVVGGVQWTAPKPADERVPHGDRVAIISVFRLFAPGHPIVRRVVVSDSARVAALARGFDELRVAPPGQITHCVMLTDKTVAYRIAFATAVHATPDVIVTDAICRPVAVTVDGGRRADLSDVSGAFGSAVAHALGQAALTFR